MRADVLSLSFDKLRFASADACHQWVKANGYDFGRCDDLGNRYVFGVSNATGQAMTLADGVIGIVRAADSDPAETTEIEVFSTGPWAGTDWTIADLDEIAANFERLKQFIQPPLKLGHDNKHLLAQHDGQPAMGWVTSLRRVGDKLLARFADVPQVVKDLVRARRYKRLSIEMNTAFEKHPAEKKLQTGVRGKVLTAVALLGATIPEVKDLADLPTVLAMEGAVFAESPPEPGSIRLLSPLRMAAHHGRGSLLDFHDRVQRAVDQTYQGRGMVHDLFPDAAVVRAFNGADESLVRHPITRGDDGSVELGEGKPVRVGYLPDELEARENPFMETSMPDKPKEEPKVDPKPTSEDRLAALEQKFAEQTAALTQKMSALEAENAALKTAAEKATSAREQTERELNHQRAVAFAESHMKAENLHLGPAQRPAAIALYERLSNTPTIKADDGKGLQLFAEGEAPRDLSLLDLFTRFISAAPPNPSLRTLSEAPAPEGGETYEMAEREIATRDKLDLAKRDDKLRVAATIHRERPYLIPKYGSRAA